MSQNFNLIPVFGIFSKIFYIRPVNKHFYGEL